MVKWSRNLFRTAGEVASLTRECLFLQKEREKLEWKVAELEKEVKAERAKKDKFVTQFCNQISVKAGLYGQFTNEEVKAKAVEQLPPVLTPFQEEEIATYAAQMRNADIDDGMQNVPPLDMYIQNMRQDPDKYLQH